MVGQLMKISDWIIIEVWEYLDLKNWYLNFGYEIWGLQLPEKKRSNQDLNPCDPFKSDPSLFFALVMDMCARFVLWICALKFAFKKRSIF